MGELVRLVISRKPPPTLNRIQSMHWNKRKKLKELWQDEVYLAVYKAGRPKFRKAAIQIILYYSAARRRDTDNLMGAAGKMLLDGLRYSGVIPDDDQETIKVMEPICEIDRKHPRVEIEILALDEEGDYVG